MYIAKNKKDLFMEESWPVVRHCNSWTKRPKLPAYIRVWCGAASQAQQSKLAAHYKNKTITLSSVQLAQQQRCHQREREEEKKSIRVKQAASFMPHTQRKLHQMYNN